MRDSRILRAMPFGFYYTPYLVTTLKHYDPVDYYEQLIGLLEHASASAHAAPPAARAPGTGRSGSSTGSGPGGCGPA